MAILPVGMLTNNTLTITMNYGTYTNRLPIKYSRERRKIVLAIPFCTDRCDDFPPLSFMTALFWGFRSRRLQRLINRGVL